MISTLVIFLIKLTYIYIYVDAGIMEADVVISELNISIGVDHNLLYT